MAKKLHKNASQLSHDRFKWLRPILVPAIVAAIVFLGIGVMIERQSSILEHERNRLEVLNQVSLIRAKLEGNINSNIQLVRGLVATVSTEPDMDQARFEALASNLFRENSQLRNIAAAPNFVVSMTYPLLGNEKAIGLDYRAQPDQIEAVLRARDTHRMVLAGPVDLVQGGVAFIGRFPVFLDMQGHSQFWGIISAVVDINRLFGDSGLFDSALNIDISLTGRDAVGGSGERFFGPDLRGMDPVTAQVFLPSGSWEIAALPKGGWQQASTGSWLIRATLLFAGLLLLSPFVMTARLIGERHKHFEQLQEREQQLDRLSRRLSMALEVSKVGVWEMDMESGEETWDERTALLYGHDLSKGEPSYQTWLNALHPDDYQRAVDEFATMIKEDRYQSDYRVLQKNGDIRHVRSIGIIYRQENMPDRAVGVNWDRTSDVELTEELRRANLLTEARNKELESARDHIEHIALHDSLTSLPNRRFLDDMLKRHAEGGFQASGSMALLHIDLDRFKQINDTLGHAAGDAVLQHVAGILRKTCEADDFVGRIGGDEFIILTSAELGDIYLATLADRIIGQMREPLMFDGHPCRFGVSIGIAADKGDDIDIKRLLINADIALYRAKARGRNRFEFFTDALQAEVVNTKRIADEILSGLERDEFFAFYQPQFDAKTLDVVGVEALARWRHPDGTIKAPDVFMGIAEELNVVASIDRIILERSLAAQRHWDEIGLDVPRISVNVSLRRLNDEALAMGLQELQIQPGRVSFELVESIYLDESDAVVGWNIEQIKDMGIDIEIDDFGTGYASIVSLQKLHPRRLKIDRQLVAPVLVDKGQRQLLSSIIEIGKSMGIEVVAEGVETMEHAAILRDLGCDILQGYAFSKPLEQTALESFLRSNSWRKTA
jgi:diguanylate cyclase (GGDEF)-like protein